MLIIIICFFCSKHICCQSNFYHIFKSYLFNAVLNLPGLTSFPNCPTKAGATIAYTGLFISFNNFIIGINSILSEIAPNLHLDTQSPQALHTSSSLQLICLLLILHDSSSLLFSSQYLQASDITDIIGLLTSSKFTASCSDSFKFYLYLLSHPIP